MENIVGLTGHEIKFGDILDSDNCYLFDSKGNRLIDLESGVWCTCVGHNNKRINEIITSQINKITHTGFCYVHPQIEIAAKKILNVTGIKTGKCEFLCSGSEAVEYGMRIARTISSKPFALTFSDSYFGAYGDAAKKDFSKWYIFNWLDCECKSSEKGCIGECDGFRNIPFDKIGIFLFEPGSSSGLVRFPSQKLISKIVTEIKSAGGIVIVNEITTGIGRTGKWFGFQHYNFTPDIVAIGKGIGNGYPVSVTAVSDSVLEQSGINDFRYAQSHQNDPLGAFVAYEVLKIIEDENLLTRCQELGGYLQHNLQNLITEKSILKQVRGRGLMLALEFRRNARQVYEELLKRGYVVCWRPNTEVLRVDPALTVEKEILDNFIDVFREVIDYPENS
jgi:acetylornithine/N-succinyldiaminopimelate aminotransferase